MSRIAGVPMHLASGEVSAAFEAAKRRFGKLPIPLGVTAHHPEIFRGYLGYEREFAQANRVDARLKSLATIKVASFVGCPF